MDKWVKVSDALLPEKQAILMVATNQGPFGTYTTDIYAGWKSMLGWARWPHDFEPTHWMIQPELPTT